MQDYARQAGSVGLQYADLANAQTAVRPIGQLMGSAQSLGKLLDELEGQRNRLHSTMERMLAPRPEGVAGNAAMPTPLQHPSLEAVLNGLVERAGQLANSMQAIVERLDAAV